MMKKFPVYIWLIYNWIAVWPIEWSWYATFLPHTASHIYVNVNWKNQQHTQFKKCESYVKIMCPGICLWVRMYQYVCSVHTYCGYNKIKIEFNIMWNLLLYCCTILHRLSYLLHSIIYWMVKRRNLIIITSV